jgi:hypothetical protein
MITGMSHWHPAPSPLSLGGRWGSNKACLSLREPEEPFSFQFPQKIKESCKILEEALKLNGQISRQEIQSPRQGCEQRVAGLISWGLVSRNQELRLHAK